MTPTMKKLVSLVLTLVLCAAMVSCAKPTAAAESPDTPTEKPVVCFIIGAHANSAPLNFTSPLIQDTVYETIRNYGYIAILSLDSSPELVYANDFDTNNEQLKKANKAKLDADARAKATGLLQFMQSVTADDPDADYLLGLQHASRVLKSVQGNTSKNIYMVGTGLSSVGYMNYNNNLLCADESSIVKALKESDNIPDLDGVTVYAQHLADTALPQQPLSQALRKKVQNDYAAIVEAAGGTFFKDVTLPLSDGYDKETSLPAVTPIELPDEMPIIFDDSNINLDNPVSLTEEHVSFIPDSARFADTEKIRATLEPVADYLKESGKQVLLCGTTAGDYSTETAFKLSLDRAIAVKNELVSMGCPADSISCIGTATENPWHVSGLSTGESAQVNRRVVLIDATSQTAKEILTSAGMQAGE